MSIARHPGTEIADCPMCNSADQAEAYEFAPYAVVRCARCNFYYLSPRPTEAAMHEMYSSGEYFEGGDTGYASYAQQERSLRATYRRLVKRLAEAGLAGGDLLEIGCGYGFLLDEAQSAFRSTMGTELSEDAAAAARRRGLAVLTGGVEAIPPGSAFDLVIASHVVEHVYRPREFVASLRDLLKPGGSLLLGTPDVGSGWRRLLRRRWPSFKVPEHILYFDRRSLTSLLEDVGLEDVRPFPFAHAFPLSLVAAKLGLGSIAGRAGRAGSLTVWLPATTLALVGRRPNR